MLVRETVLSGAEHPGTKLQVLESTAGFYLGYKDKTGMPYTRESRYFRTRKGAESLLGALRHD